MKRKIFSIAIILLTSFCFATSTKDLFPNINEESYQRLMKGEVICTILSPDEKYSVYTNLESMGTDVDVSAEDTLQSIIPEGSESKKIAKDINDVQQGFCAAALAFLPYPEKLKEMNPSERQNYLFNLATKISTLKGLKYNSHFSGDKIIVLFKDAYAINNTNTPNEPIEDPIFAEAPETFSCFAMLKDNRFGNNIYKVNYKTNPNEIFMDVKNEEKIKFLTITCLKKETLDMYVDIIQTDEGLVVFTMSKTNSKTPHLSFGPFAIDIPESFTKRIIALGWWFSNNLNDE